MLLRVIFGISGLIGALLALRLIGQVAWEEFKTLNYLHRLDEWSSDVPDWDDR